MAFCVTHNGGKIEGAVIARDCEVCHKKFLEATRLRIPWRSLEVKN